MSRRGRRPHTQADMRLMADVSRAFERKGREFKNFTAAAKDLEVSRAAFYKYWRKKNVPGLDVLKRAYEKWGFLFEYGGIKLDADFFKRNLPLEGASEKRPETASQYTLPFLQAVTERDIKIINVQAPKRPGTKMKVVLEISFAG